MLGAGAIILGFALDLGREVIYVGLFGSLEEDLALRFRTFRVQELKLRGLVLRDSRVDFFWILILRKHLSRILGYRGGP